MTEEVRGKRVLVKFEGHKCIHSRGCVLGRPDVFVPNVEGEWIHPDACEPGDVAEIAHGCPSGAITYERLDGGPQEAPPIVNTLRVRENGPYALNAAIEIVGHGPALRATLCRCGLSKRKPFCDASHHGAFVSTGEPAGGVTEVLATRDGAVVVTPQKDGPLQVEGSLEIVTGTGATIAKTKKTWLCRCGGSSKKPFCDGSHRKLGFTAE